MKILIIQLARLGDIYLSWPAVRGLRRLYPEAEIHVLSRPRFQAAWQGLTEVDRHHVVPAQQIIEPLLEATPNVKNSFQEMGGWVDQLKAEGFDRILNFSFSPFSSFLTHAISNEKTQVAGYTRFADGYLAIPDDMSAFFYAQVGIGRPNRFHLAEIFGTMAGCDLIEQDWQAPAVTTSLRLRGSVMIHIGASESKKQVSFAKWTTVINQFLRVSSENITLIGSAEESDLATKIMSAVPAERVDNLVGKTSLQDVMALLTQAKVLVGADSAPMHMASLTRTPCVNLSFDSVNFWETGPRAPNSVILKGHDETDMASDKIANAIRKVIARERPDVGVATVQKGTPSYWSLTTKEADFQWQFLRAIYLCEDFPPSADPLFIDGISKLHEINALMIEQMQSLQRGVELQRVAPFIDRGEEIIQAIGQLVPSLACLVRWYQTEKIRIGPDSRENLLQRSLDIQQLLQKVLDLYLESFTAQGLPLPVTAEAAVDPTAQRGNL
jgi:ADP-heptose:LPS heptosyltransferase